MATRFVSPHKTYCLNLDGPMFREQRKLLLKLLERSEELGQMVQDDEIELLTGLLCLTDDLADQAHDDHDIDCLIG